MAKPYDSTTKYLIERYPADCLRLAGLGPIDRVAVVDANLSTITAEADKVIRVDAPKPWLAHVEWQSTYDAALPRRVLQYNAMLGYRHRLPVRSIIVLLRESADGPQMTGNFHERWPGGARYLSFRYHVVRAWQLPVDRVLAGDLGTLPMAPVADLGPTSLDEVIRRMSERIAPEPPDVADFLWLATGVLMGLVHPPELIVNLLKGVRDMEDSSYYRMIFDRGAKQGEARGVAIGEARGVAIGRVGEARRILVRQATRRFGPADPATLARLDAINEAEPIEAIFDRLTDATGWADLLTGLATGN